MNGCDGSAIHKTANWYWFLIRRRTGLDGGTTSCGANLGWDLLSTCLVLHLSATPVMWYLCRKLIRMRNCAVGA